MITSMIAGIALCAGLMFGPRAPIPFATEVKTYHCVEGGSRWDYQQVDQIWIRDGDKVTVMERVPCGVGNVWHERSASVLEIPSNGGTSGVFGSGGDVVFTGMPANYCGIINIGAGTCCRSFTPTSSGDLVISAQLMQEILTQ